jgi:hypothetical protein
MPCSVLRAVTIRRPLELPNEMKVWGGYREVRKGQGMKIQKKLDLAFSATMD